MLPCKEGEPHPTWDVQRDFCGAGPLDCTTVSPTSAVQIRGLVKRYSGRAVVDGLDLDATPGQVTAVLGPNGAGKTTTIECCEGLRTPDGGSVQVLGLDPLTDAPALRPRVGVMLQDGGLPTSVRALEMLTHVSRMYANPRDVGELTDRLGLESFGRTTVRRLSGGQRQRLALATAIVGRPEVVFLDEPSAGMDPQSRHAVWDLVRELRDDGVAIILTTHLMDEAAELADHVAIVDHGRVIASGTVGELTSAGSDEVLTLTSDQPWPDDDGLASALADTYLRVRVTGPHTLQVSGPVDAAAIARVTSWCAANDILVRSLDLGRRTLEDVFLDLTGRNLR